MAQNVLEAFQAESLALTKIYMTVSKEIGKLQVSPPALVPCHFMSRLALLGGSWRWQPQHSSEVSLVSLAKPSAAITGAGGQIGAFPCCALGLQMEEQLLEQMLQRAEQRQQQEQAEEALALEAALEAAFEAGAEGCEAEGGEGGEAAAAESGGADGEGDGVLAAGAEGGGTAAGADCTSTAPGLQNKHSQDGGSQQSQ